MTCGIYAIVNSTNDKVYIGQAINIEKRWREHKRELENKKHINKHLENSYYKYGKDSFNFIILHECNEDELNYYEMKYILLYESTTPKKGYNKTYGGGSEKPTQETRKKLSESLKGRILSEETRKKQSEWHKGKILPEETRKKISDSLKGRIISEEQRKKISELNKGKLLSEETRKKIGEGNKGKTLSEETRKKISETLKGRILPEEHRKKISDSHKGKKYSAKKLYVYNIVTNEIKIYNCKDYLVQEFYKKGYTKAIGTGKNYLIISYKHTKVNTKIPFHEYVIFSTQELLDNYLKENNLIKEVS